MNLRRLASYLAVFFCLAGVSPRPPPPLRCRRTPTPISAGAWSGRCAAGGRRALPGFRGSRRPFYFGAAAGGVWKTEDAGATWSAALRPRGRGVGRRAGRRAVRPEGHLRRHRPDPARYDIASGDGVYRSGDGGKTWEHAASPTAADRPHRGGSPRRRRRGRRGARAHLRPQRRARHLPHRGRRQDLGPGALRGRGHGRRRPRRRSRPRPTRLRRRSGRRATTPGSPTSPPRSGRGAGSTSRPTAADVERLSATGWPPGHMGRIGLAVAPGSRAARVYATIESGQGGPGVYRSDDGGGSWQRVNATAGLASGYMDRVTVDPEQPGHGLRHGAVDPPLDRRRQDASVLHGRAGRRRLPLPVDQPEASGAHGHGRRPGHGRDGQRRARAGATGTTSRPASSTTSPPTTGSRTGSTAASRTAAPSAVASRSDYGQLTFRDWHPVGGDERDWDIPDPGDPDIVYGSGLGGAPHALGRPHGAGRRTSRPADLELRPAADVGALPLHLDHPARDLAPAAARDLHRRAVALPLDRPAAQSWETVSPDLDGRRARDAPTATATCRLAQRGPAASA